MKNLFRELPAVDVLLEGLQQDGELGTVPRSLLRDLINEFLDICREEIKNGSISEASELDPASLYPRVLAFVRSRSRPHFRRVLNATGVVVHTNLGRSLLGGRATDAVSDACKNYSNLEFSLQTGRRGSRYTHVEELLCRLTGAEAGLVVNNNAAAVLLILDTLAKGREVIVSRGQLVEIGGSFRIPEVMAKSGAVLREVGATNRTHVHDYKNAVCEQTAALLKVHTSNYRIIGFHKEVSLSELVQMGAENGLPVIEDMGSGNFFDFKAHGYSFMHEPTVQQVIKAGVTVVSFSGDKLLGGPQAGIILGKKDYIERIKINPLNRAVRIDKMTLAALESTLREYLDMDRAVEEIPTLNMICAQEPILKKRALRLQRIIQRKIGGRRIRTSLIRGNSRVGGGAFPEQNLPTCMLGLRPAGLGISELKDRLLHSDPPLIGRVEDDWFCLDVRTLRDEEFALVCEALKQGLEV
ncbi:MAG: L-seryl-tRNA(Sec) selenium transferase [Thermodesulfobacteriota bacterium]